MKTQCGNEALGTGREGGEGERERKGDAGTRREDDRKRWRHKQNEKVGSEVCVCVCARVIASKLFFFYHIFNGLTIEL